MGEILWCHLNRSIVCRGNFESRHVVFYRSSCFHFVTMFYKTSKQINLWMIFVLVNPLTANDEISRRVIKTPRLPTTRYFVAFFMSQNCQRRDISPTLRQNGTRQHRSSKATGDRKCLTIHVTHSFLISIKTNTLFFDIIIYFNVVNYK